MKFSVRGFTRRAAKPVVMAVVAASLALSLTVTTTQRAEATPAVAVLPVIAAAESVLAGGVALSMPSVLAVSLALHPVGWAIGLGALGVGLWATSDHWLPWVQDPLGSWGKATGANPSSAPGAGSGPVIPEYSIDSLSGFGTDYVTFNGGFSTKQTYTRATATAWGLSCKNTVTGVVTARTFSLQQSWTASELVPRPASGQAFCRSSATSGSKIANEVIEGAIIGPHGSDPAVTQYCPGQPLACAYAGPANVLRGGTKVETSTPAFDPRGADVKYKTTSECVDAGGNKTTITAESFGDEGGIKFPSCAAAGKGHGTGNTSVIGIAPGTTTETPLWGTQPSADPTQPLCDPQRPGSGCKMQITIDGKPCTVGAWDCENWTDIYNDATTKPRVGCTYGPYTLEVDQCKVMEPAYRPGGAPATEENMDGDPATRSNLQPGGTTYAPPATGTGTVPGMGGQPQPGADAQSAQCFPQGWSMLNPVEWVLQPIRCAFTPSPNTATNLTTRINTKISTVGFAPVATAWGDAFNSVGGGSGCAGPTVNFSMNGVQQQFQPFNACSGPMQQAAGVSTAILSLGVIFFGGLGIVRAIGSAFGFNFSMGGKTDGD